LRDDPKDCIAKIPDTVLANGSFVVDHFSKEGAKTVIDYWNNHILTALCRVLFW
jgi:hypothetical protein